MRAKIIARINMIKEHDELSFDLDYEPGENIIDAAIYFMTEVLGIYRDAIEEVSIV